MVRDKDFPDEWFLSGVMSAGFTSTFDDCEKLGGYSAYSDLSHQPIRSWLMKIVGSESFQDENSIKKGSSSV